MLAFNRASHHTTNEESLESEKDGHGHDEGDKRCTREDMPVPTSWIDQVRNLDGEYRIGWQEYFCHQEVIPDPQELVNSQRGDGRSGQRDGQLPESLPMIGAIQVR